MARPIAAIMCLLFCCIAAQAGVVVVMESSELSSEGEPAVDTIYAAGGMLRMDPGATNDAEAMSMIFRDDTLFVVDHGTTVVQQIDREGIEDLSAQMSDAMSHMQAEMAKLPPEQRAMMEQRMKERTVRGMPGMGEELPERRVEAEGSDTVAGYDCTVHRVYAEDEIVSEMCSAPAGDLPDAQEAVDAFRAMAAFAQELMEAARQGPMARMIENPFQNMDTIDGFPVRVRNYRDGRLIHESILRSIEAQDLDPATFEIPEDYRIDDLSEQLTKARP